MPVTEIIRKLGIVEQTFYRWKRKYAGLESNQARALHQNYLKNRIAEGESVMTNPLLVSWDKLPEDVRHANRQQSLAIREELLHTGHGIEPQRDWRSIPNDLSDEDLDSLASIEHKRWVKERKAQGWKPGKDKDKDRKTHPHPQLKPWDELEGDETKNRARRDMSTLPLALAEIGFAIRR
jgi:hypothetical protein